MSRSKILASRLRDRVIVTCKDATIFGGLLYSHDDRALVLRHSEVVGAGDNSTNIPLDGEIIVLMADVSYIQVTT